MASSEIGRAEGFSSNPIEQLSHTDPRRGYFMHDSPEQARESVMHHHKRVSQINNVSLGTGGAKGAKQTRNLKPLSKKQISTKRNYET